MKTRIIVPALLCLVFAQCGQSYHKEEDEYAPPSGSAEAVYEEAEESADMAAEETEKMEEGENKKDANFISSTAAKVNKDSSRKFIRTADMRFRVKNVRTSTTRIEDVVARFDGFVTHTHLSSDVDRRTEIPVSKDSLLATTYYTVRNDMTIRIPNTVLDTTLRLIAREMLFLDHRTISADDVTLQMLANRIRQKRLDRHTGRVTRNIDQRNDRLYESTYAEDRVLDRALQADETYIQNLRMQANVDYSTVHLSFYQSQNVERELIANLQDIDAYKPSFGNNAKEGFLKGWEVMKEFFVGLITIWPLYLLAAFIWMLVRRTRKQKS